MDKSVLVIVLALATLVLTMAWAYFSMRKAKAGLDTSDPDRVSTGKAQKAAAGEDRR